MDPIETKLESAVPSKSAFLTPSGFLLAAFASAVGAITRLLEYFHNRSLWLDEAHVALHILGPRFWERLFAGKYLQTMPVGLVVLERLMYETFGPSELVLRFIPLVCGLGVIGLAFIVAGRVCLRSAWPLAVAVIATSESLIYFSSEMKQYSGDVFLTLAAYALCIGRGGLLRRPHPVAFAAFGAFSVWFSHPIVFVLAGLAVIFFAESVIEGVTGRLKSLIAVLAVWSVSFLAVYLASIRKIASGYGLVAQWESYGSFLPAAKGPLSVAIWSIERVGEAFRMSIGGPFVWVCVVCFGIGCASLWRRNRTVLAALLLPGFFAVLASMVRLYAFNDRLLLFLSPAIIFLTAEGVGAVYERGRSLRPTAIILAGLLLYTPLVHTFKLLRTPTVREEIKPLLRDIERLWDSDSSIYVYYSAAPAVKYYFATREYDIEKTKVWYGIRSRGARERYSQDVYAASMGRRKMWFVFSHAIPEEQKLILEHADSIGERLTRVSTPGATGYLYRFPDGKNEAGE